MCGYGTLLIIKSCNFSLAKRFDNAVNNVVVLNLLKHQLSTTELYALSYALEFYIPYCLLKEDISAEFKMFYTQIFRLPPISSDKISTMKTVELTNILAPQLIIQNSNSGVNTFVWLI